MNDIPTEIWSGDFCFRYDPTAPKYGDKERRLYRLVGFEKFYSISYEPLIWPGSPWRSILGHKTPQKAADYTIKQLNAEVKKAETLIAAVKAHKRTRVS